MSRSRFRMASARWPVVGAAAVLLFAAQATAGVFTPVSQSREVRADDHHLTIGYTCLGGGGGPPLPACPETLEDTTTSDVHLAPGFSPDPFAVTAVVTSTSNAHASTVQPTLISATGGAIAMGSAAELTDPPDYLLIVDAHDRSTLDSTTLTVDLDEATPFTFEASGRIVYPDPGVPLSWDVKVEISLEGPGGTVATFDILPDFGCPDGDPQAFTCWVEPPPLVVTGSLPAGEYTLHVRATTNGNGSWLPSTGPLGASASAEYDTSLSLGGAPQVPLLAPGALVVLSALLVGAGTLAGPLRRR